ncbi:sugar-binding transcriptional regulator [Saccharomonospora cyanea]|uniref:Transcriptional regulator with sigma factor-related N-terminal domain n=1 Tax=Saccharomonospora cyanea NA-134 TaxID=882082 RepID=H5XLJ4_9PSEU|nr:sugar-binding domain-containing protein [Saccharomonospora cyanea]EHR59863.1 transcriptional regulator with sigma factor-related N-terminal domain [Saccharomonospora cyanea NA-134]
MSARNRSWSLLDTVETATIAHRFYVRGESKLDIAKDMGMSRFKVARLLDKALETGLVRIEFSLPEPVEVGLSEELRAAYGLRNAFVLERAEKAESRPELRQRIGALAARLLSDIATVDDVIGLSWARSVNVMTEHIRTLPRCPIVQLCGVQAGMDRRDRSVETVSRLAGVSGGEAYPIYAPLVLPDRRTTDILRRQPGIVETFRRYRDLTKAVVSIGAWREGESTVYDALSQAERDSITRRGATAEVAARLFDADGNALDTGLSHHVLAISHEELRRVPEVIALGYTIPKAEAVDAVLRSGTVTTLVTDHDTARRVLDLAEQRPPSP